MTGHRTQKAHNKKVSKLLREISEDELLLPNFQRQEAWKEKNITKLLQSVYEERPLGILLIVPYDANQHQGSQLERRRFSGIKQGKIIDDIKPRDLLLDGQQRLTALWKVFNDGYDDKLFCIQLQLKEDEQGYSVDDKNMIMAIAKKNKKTGEEREFYKKIKNDSHKQFKRKSKTQKLPISLFNPEKSNAEWNKLRDEWLEKIPETKRVELKGILDNIRNRFIEAEMAYFRLPTNTTASEAATIFMDINTGSASLTHYDIVVADIYSEKQQYLEEIMADPLRSTVKNIEKIDKDVAGELIVKIACVLDGKTPSGANYMKFESYEESIFAKKDDIIDGVKNAVEWLEELKIYNRQQLPTVVPLRVLPSLYKNYKKYVNGSSTIGKSQREAKAKKVVKQYLWRAFLTERYRDSKIDENLLDDYKDLKKCFSSSLNPDLLGDVPILKEETPTDIEEARWPKSDILFARGILMACVQGGGLDPISGESLCKDDFTAEYHHIFPKSRLEGIEDVKHDLALNCLLVSPETNVEFDNDLPGTYLTKLWEEGSVEKDVIKRNLDTQLIDEDLFEYLLNIKNESYEDDEDGLKLKQAYEGFIEKRSALVRERIGKLIQGEEI